jgi:fatty acid desaturase
MEISEEKKLEILLAQLQERYEALHKMRDRSMQFALWILGLGLGMSWLLINETALTCPQQWAINCLLILLGFATFWFVYGIERGFKTIRQIVIKLETAIKLYDQDFYGIHESILPIQFSKEKRKWTNHFKTLYIIIITVFVALIILTWANPCNVNPTKTYTSNPNQMQIKAVNK